MTKIFFNLTKPQSIIISDSSFLNINSFSTLLFLSLIISNNRNLQKKLLLYSKKLLKTNLQLNKKTQ